MLGPTQDVTLDGKTYTLTRFDAITGREILTQYPMTAIPKVSEYSTNEALMLKVLAHVYVTPEGREPMALNSRALVINHVPRTETLMQLEWAMMMHNFEFLKNGAASGFLEALLARFQESIGSTLTQLLASLSAKD